MANQFQNLSFEALFNAASDAMLLTDTSGQVVQANPAARLLLGYSEEKIIGLEVEALMPQRYRDHHRLHREIFNTKPEKRSMGSGAEFTVLTDDGKELEVNISLSPMPSGNTTYTLVTLYVADRRRQAIEKLRISEERLQMAKQAAGLGVFDFDSNHHILHWDARMQELWGAESEKSLNSKRFSTIIHPEDSVAREKAMDRAIDPAGNGEYKIEYRVINPANQAEHWVSAIGRMHFENGQATRLIGVAYDITDRKMLEKKALEHRTETESIFTQQIATQTASAIAHELNQPLAAISAYSEVALHALDNAGTDQPSLRRALEGCVKQAQRAGASLHELLAFLQKGDLVRDRLNLNEIVKEALNITKSNGFGGFYPILQLDEDLPLVLGNRIQVLKILVNLLRNSIEAMHKAGMPSAAITITVRTNNNINMAHVTVRDSGPGLDPETAKRIFEPFFTTKPTGIGMGLAISRALAEANGGQLWLEPNNKPGAVFHFTLPFAE